MKMSGNELKFCFWGKKTHPEVTFSKWATFVIIMGLVSYVMLGTLWYFFVVSPVERQRIEGDKGISIVAASVLAGENISQPQTESCRKVSHGENSFADSQTCRSYIKESCGADENTFICDMWELWQEKEIGDR